MTDPTNTERQARFVKRRADNGMKLIRVWVPADKAEAVKEAIAAALDPIAAREKRRVRMVNALIVTLDEGVRK